MFGKEGRAGGEGGEGGVQAASPTPDGSLSSTKLGPRARARRLGFLGGPGGPLLARSQVEEGREPPQSPPRVHSTMSRDKSRSHMRSGESVYLPRCIAESSSRRFRPRMGLCPASPKPVHAPGSRQHHLTISSTNHRSTKKKKVHAQQAQLQTKDLPYVSPYIPVLLRLCLPFLGKLSSPASGDPPALSCSSGGIIPRA